MCSKVVVADIAAVGEATGQPAAAAVAAVVGGTGLLSVSAEPIAVPLLPSQTDL